MTSHENPGKEETLPFLKSQQVDLEQSEAQLVLQLAKVRSELALVRAKVADSTNFNRNAGIYAFPAETQADIFVAFHEDDTPFPILVSHISRRFRNVAVHEPTLWTEIKMYQSSSSVSWLEIRLARSGAC
jgi:hypothetical protein